MRPSRWKSSSCSLHLFLDVDGNLRVFNYSVASGKVVKNGINSPSNSQTFHSVGFSSNPLASCSKDYACGVPENKTNTCSMLRG